MTDLLINSNGDLDLQNGQLVLVPTTEQLTQQRLKVSLSTFTGTWFANQNFGIDSSLIFEKGSKGFLDEDIKSIVSSTEGVLRLVSYSSTVDTQTRKMVVNFKYEVAIINLDSSIAGVGTGGETTTVSSIFQFGVWYNNGTWDHEMVWGI